MRYRSWNNFNQKFPIRLALLAGFLLFAMSFAPVQPAAAQANPWYEFATGSCAAPNFATEVTAGQTILLVSGGLMSSSPFNFIVAPFGETSRPAWWYIEQTVYTDPNGSVCVEAFATAATDYGMFIVTIHSLDADQHQYNPATRGVSVLAAPTETPTRTPTETATPEPTETPTLMATSSPADKVAPTATPTPAPKSTRQPGPVVIAALTLTPMSTATPAPAITLTSTPTEIEKSTPAPTKEMASAPVVMVSPASTPQPTETPLPAATATPLPASPSPVPPTTVSQAQSVLIAQVPPTANPQIGSLTSHGNDDRLLKSVSGQTSAHNVGLTSQLVRQKPVSTDRTSRDYRSNDSNPVNQSETTSATHIQAKPVLITPQFAPVTVSTAAPQEGTNSTSFSPAADGLNWLPVLGAFAALAGLLASRIRK